MTVDKDIPIPPSRQHLDKSKYPWATMNVGDSFLFSINTDRLTQQKGNTAARSYVRFKKLDWKFETRKTESGIRIWRVR